MCVWGGVQASACVAHITCGGQRKTYRFHLAEQGFLSLCSRLTGLCLPEGLSWGHRCPSYSSWLLNLTSRDESQMVSLVQQESLPTEKSHWSKWLLLRKIQSIFSYSQLDYFWEKIQWLYILDLRSNWTEVYRNKSSVLEYTVFPNTRKKNQNYK